VAGLKPDRTPPDEITVFTSTGLAVQNVAIANLAYKKALAKELGKLVEIV
jgi:alanine dehydrogenase